MECVLDISNVTVTNVKLCINKTMLVRQCWFPVIITIRIMVISNVILPALAMLQLEYYFLPI